MCCPFFVPRQLTFAAAGWPLGGRWSGACAAALRPPDGGHAGDSGEWAIDAAQLEGCNLGYALKCPRLPATRAADRVSFALGRSHAGRLLLQFALEREHAPAACGHLLFDLERQAWLRPHTDSRLQCQAEAFLHAARLASASAGEKQLGLFRENA